ncbi:MAG: hypothetical protein ACOH10_13635 [Rhodoglobus sp.]
MASGGARPRSGPAKDPNSLRTAMSQDHGEWQTLPVGDWGGDVPECPLPGVSDAEFEMWETYWRKPQAAIWSANGMEIEVALHVRHLVEAIQSDAPTTARTLVRQQMDALLLTHKALSDAKIRIGIIDAPTATVSRATRPSSRERRLRAVPDEGA